MAIEKEINLNVNSNIEGSIGQLKALKKELKGVDVGTEEFKKLYNQIDDLEDKIKSAKNKSSDWIDSLEQAGGPIGLLGASINKAKVATQSFSGALKATGIGLIVSLVAGLAAAFNDNEKAQKKLQPLLEGIRKIFAGIFTVVEPLFNTLVDLAVSALPTVSKAFSAVYSSVTAVFQSLGALGSAIKKLISGDFSGAWKDAKSSVTDFGKHYDEANKRFEDGSKQLTKTQSDELSKRKEDERKHQQELANNQRAANDKAKEERKRVAEEKQDAEKASFDAEKSLVEDQLKNTKISIDEKRNIVLNDNKLSKEDRQKFLIDLQNQEILAEENHNKAIADLNQKYDDEKATRLADTAVKKEQLDYDKRLAEINSIAQTEIEKQTLIEKLDAEHKVRMEVANKADAKTQADIEQAKFDLKIQLWNQIGSALGGLGSLFKKNTAAAKVAALAEIAIGTATGLINGLDIAQKSAKGTGPAAAFAFPLFYATQVVAVLGAVGRAKSVLESGGDGGGGGGGSAPSAASAPSAPSFNVVGNGGANQIAGVMANKEMPPIKTYVVAGDVTTQQGLNMNIKNNATIG